MLTFRLSKTPIFTRVVNLVNLQMAVFQGASGERKMLTKAEIGKRKSEMGKRGRKTEVRNQQDGKSER
jgi:hypothetical protein